MFDKIIDRPSLKSLVLHPLFSASISNNQAFISDIIESSSLLNQIQIESHGALIRNRL